MTFIVSSAVPRLTCVLFACAANAEARPQRTLRPRWPRETLSTCLPSDACSEGTAGRASIVNAGALTSSSSQRAKVRWYRHPRRHSSAAFPRSTFRFNPLDGRPRPLRSSGAAPERGRRAGPPAGPRGLVIPGRSFAGVRIGDTWIEVRSLWGTRVRDVQVLRRRDVALRVPRLGAARRRGALRARQGGGGVLAGLAAGWRTNRGLYIGDPIGNVYGHYTTTGTTRCIGFDAITVRTGRTSPRRSTAPPASSPGSRSSCRR